MPKKLDSKIAARKNNEDTLSVRGGINRSGPVKPLKLFFSIRLCLHVCRRGGSSVQCDIDRLSIRAIATHREHA